MVFKGFSQPLIGNFILPIGDLIWDLREERSTELAAVQKIIEEMEKISNDDAPPSYNIQNKKFESLIVAEANEAMKEQIASHFKPKDEEAKKSLLSDV